MRKFAITILISLFVVLLGVAQQITVNLSGTLNPSLNETKVYYAEFRNEHGQLVAPPWGDAWWSVSGGTLTSSGVDRAYIQWIDSGPGQIFYEFDDGVNYYWTSLSVNVISSAPETPSTSFNFENYCGSTKVTRTSNPPSGVEWFWQTSSDDTSTLLGSLDNVTVSFAALYLRARSGSTWSVNSLQITGLTFINTPPSEPASATHGHAIKNEAVAIPVSVSSLSGATSYKWYTASGSLVTTTTLPSYTPTVSTTTTYYVASVISSCESTARTPVTASLYPEPIIAATNGARITSGDPVILSVSNFSYDNYEWIRVGSSGFTTGTNYQVHNEGLYKVRVKKASSAWFETPVGMQVWEGLNGQNVNYIISNNIQVPNITDASSIKNLSFDENMQSVQYFDGIGRLIQTVATQNTPLKRDLVQPTVYDAFGRETHRYLPYASGDPNTPANTGLYKTDFLSQHEPDYISSNQNVFYNGSGAIANGANKPFAETRFENSPLNRVIEQGSPGVAWQPDQNDSYLSVDRTVKFSYEVNVAEEVLLWTYIYPSESNPTGKVMAKSGTSLIYYGANQLYKNRTKDEQFHEVLQYTDKQGRMVLNRVQATDNVWADTYYIYDDSGNLVCVLPPEASRLLLEN
jgi:hypothetical protein